MWCSLGGKLLIVACRFEVDAYVIARALNTDTEGYGVCTSPFQETLRVAYTLEKYKQVNFK